MRIARGAALRSLALGVAGRADVVEFHGEPPLPFPVEYKRGKPKPHRADEVQLCAQAICLEEMFGAAVPEGALFYGETRRRTGGRLRRGAARADRARPPRRARAMIAAGRTPPPVLHAGLPPLLAARRCASRRGWRGRPRSRAGSPRQLAD